MTLQTPNDYILVPGKVDICVGFPSAYTTLYKIGESTDGIRVEKRIFLNGVPGDRYGGNAGPPIERQFLGAECSFQLSMSRVDSDQIVKIEKLGGLLSSAGTIPLAAIGALLHRDHGIRILLYATRDTTRSINFPCCIWDQPMTKNKGTKFEEVAMGITATRAPEGYWYSAAEGILYNSDTTGY